MVCITIYSENYLYSYNYDCHIFICFPLILLMIWHSVYENEVNSSMKYNFVINFINLSLFYYS